MEDKYYSADNLSVWVHFYPVDGVQIQVDTWDGDGWRTIINSRFIADSFFDAMFSALYQAGFNSEHAGWQLAEWNIVEPEYEEA